ncbi:hypothetical protein CHS0354_019857, partial [Potamilus streckersoni]
MCFTAQTLEDDTAPRQVGREEHTNVADRTDPLVGTEPPHFYALTTNILRIPVQDGIRNARTNQIWRQCVELVKFHITNSAITSAPPPISKQQRNVIGYISQQQELN